MSKKPNKEPIQSLKGFHDILPADVPYYDRVGKEVRRVSEYYGFQTIRLPHVENAELFTRTLGETSDIVEKQMYNFRTRGGSSVVLRPEGTASMVRAYVEHGMQSLPQPVSLFYEGSFFRHENPQAGRLREFRQAGIEVLGEKDPIHDTLIIRVLLSALDALGIRDVQVSLNSIGDKASRPHYIKELTAYYRKNIGDLCKDCKRRLKENPMRVLDCKDANCVLLKTHAPQSMNYLSEESKKHFSQVLEHFDEIGISYEIDPWLVRGLDYYNDTVFELFVPAHRADDNVKEVSAMVATASDEEADKDKGVAVEKPATTEHEEDVGGVEEGGMLALGGGGRYDMLASMLFGKTVFGAGGALGIDRVVGEIKRRNLKIRPDVIPKVFLIQIGPTAKRKILRITEDLRKVGIPFAHALGKDALKRQLSIADKMKVPYALIIGQKEAIEERAILRSMETGTQEHVAFEKIPTVLKLKLKA